MMRLDKGVGGERSEEQGPVVPPCSPGVHSKELKGFFCRLLQQQHFVAKMLQGTRQSWETLKGKSERKEGRKDLFFRGCSSQQFSAGKLLKMLTGSRELENGAPPPRVTPRSVEGAGTRKGSLATKEPFPG